MKRVWFGAAVAGCAMFAGSSQAAVITHTFDMNVTDGGATPSGAPTVTFNDMGGAGTVTMTIDLRPLSGTEFVSTYWFNFSGAGTTPLAISRTGGTGPTSSWITISPISADGYNSAGANGLFDAMIAFETSNQGAGIRRFNADETLIFSLSGAGITAANFDVMSAVGGGGSGSQFGQMHIQGIGNGSAHVSPDGEGPPPGVPEPGALALLSLGLFGAVGLIRRRSARVIK